MLKTQLLHPELLSAIASAGHGSQILIADGNYPVSTGSAAGAKKVYLNLSPGLVSVTQVLKVIAGAVPIEAAHVMEPADGSTPPIFSEFEALIPGLELQRLERFIFYKAASQPTLCVAIATGEQRIYANILLTIGVVLPA